MHIAILGRQPALGLAELEKVFSSNNITPISNKAALIASEQFDVQVLGGTPKAGKVIFEFKKSNWQTTSQKIVQHYFDKWSSYDGKITLGLSVYGFDVSSREVQKVGILLKQKLKKADVSLRLVPNDSPALSSAVSHHNKLGLSVNKVEIIVVKSQDGTIYIAESVGSQNITAYARRDQARPMRDAFVGMLPPKLAQIMINIAVGSSGTETRGTILDPFCGTGVILQEAALLGYTVYGTDLSEKMIRYSRDNLNWLAESHKTSFEWFLHEGDAMNTKWRQPIDAVVSEVYLGQPFSAPPLPAKLDEVVGNCNHILTEFLKNLAPQIKSGTPVCLAVPAWRDKNGSFTHLPIIATIARLGYIPHEFKNVSIDDLMYYRENQVVARELLIVRKK